VIRLSRIPYLCTALVVTLSSCSKYGNTPEPENTVPTPVTWNKPAHFPEPVYDFSRNPLTEQGIELGRFLFYDGILSRTNQIGCGTCHQQEAAFTHHGHELSHGVDDLLGTRNSPSVQNMAWNPSFFWDGGVHDLDMLPFNPIQNPVEMDETVQNVIVKLKSTPLASSKKKVDYPKMFKRAFGSDDVTSERMMKALSQFMLSMVSATSKYDEYALGDVNALTSEEKEGMSIFKSKCSSCHKGELFTDFSFRNNGLVPIKINDQGRFGVTGIDTDLYKFKVPSLRNVGLTAPYMHDGRYHSLEEVLDHYAESVHKSNTLDPIFTKSEAKIGIDLSPSERQAIITFLKTLNDAPFIKNAKFSDPGVGTSF
jgi:cytochrome c peroxidase